MDSKLYLQHEAAAGRYVGHQLIKKAAELFAKNATLWSFTGGDRATRARIMSWSFERCIRLANAAYEDAEGFDGEPTNPDTLVRLMNRRLKL